MSLSSWDIGMFPDIPEGELRRAACTDWLAWEIDQLIEEERKRENGLCISEGADL